MPSLAANGINIEYEIAGRAGDPVILLVMGLGGPLVAWPDTLFHGLADQGFRVIRYDHRDVGRSTHLAQLGMPDIPGLVARRTAGETVTPPYTLDDMAADAAALLKNGLGVEKAHVAGVYRDGRHGGATAGLESSQKVKSLASIMSTTGKPGLPHLIHRRLRC